MNTQEEPHFLVDDFLIEANQELEQVITALNKKSPPYYEKSRFLKNFIGNMFRAYHQKKKEWGMEEKYNTIIELKEAEKEEHMIESYIEKKSELKKIREEQKEKIKQELMKKKEEILKKIEILIKEKDQNAGIPIPQPLDANKTISILSPDAQQKPQSEVKPTTSLSEIEKISSFSEISELPKAQEPETRKNFLNFRGIEDLKSSSEYKSFIGQLVTPNQESLKEESQEFGKITGLINNQEIKEIICDGPDQSLKTVENTKERIIELKLTDQEINDIIQILALKSEQKVTKENPFLMTQYKNLNIQATITTEHSQPRFVIVKE